MKNIFNILSIGQLKRIILSGLVVAFIMSLSPNAMAQMHLAGSNVIDNIHTVNTTEQMRINSETSCSSTCSPNCYYEESKECTFCGLLKTFFNASSRMAKISIDTLNTPVKTLVTMAMGIWIAVTILAFLASVEVKDTKDLITSILNQAFIFAIVFILLQTGAQSFFNLALEPIFNTGMTIAQKAIAPVKETNVTQCQNGTYGIYTEKEGGGLPSSMGDNIICTMTMVQNQVAKIKAVGSAALCHSWSKGQRWFIFPQMQYFFIGLGMYIAGVIMIIAIPFLMIDVIFQLAIAAALLPAAIGCYTFKVTRKYVKKVWETFLNSMFSFLFLSIITLMLTSSFSSILSDSITNFDELFNDNTPNIFARIGDELDWFGLRFIKIVFVLALTWTLMGQIGEFAGEFSGSISGTKIGSSIGTMGASFAKSSAVNLGKRPAKAIRKEAWKQTKRLGRGAVHGVRMLKYVNTRNRVMQYGVYNAANGTYTLGNKKVSVNSNGKKSLTTTKQNKKFLFFKAEGEKVITQDKYFKKIATMKNGALEHVKVRMNKDTINKIIKSDGTYDPKVMSEILNKSSLSENELLTILASETIKKRELNQGKNMRSHSVTSQTIIKNADGSGYQLQETYADGSTSVIKMTYGPNNRLKSEYIKTDKKNRVKSTSSDGIIRMEERYKIDSAGAKSKIQQLYGYTEHYKKMANRKYSNKIPLAESLYSQDEILKAQKYYRTSTF